MAESLYQRCVALTKKLPDIVESGRATPEDIRLMALLVECYSENEGYFPLWSMKHNANYKFVFNE